MTAHRPQRCECQCPGCIAAGVTLAPTPDLCPKCGKPPHDMKGDGKGFHAYVGKRAPTPASLDFDTLRAMVAAHDDAEQWNVSCVVCQYRAVLNPAPDVLRSRAKAVVDLYDDSSRDYPDGPTMQDLRDVVGDAT